VKGIDISIDKQRRIFEDYLFKTHSCQFYGRVMRNYRDNQLVPEVLIGAGHYQDTLPDTKYDVIAFFDVQPTRTADRATVDIYFAVNIGKMFPAFETERATEYAISDILLLVRRGGMFTVEEFTEGYEGWSQWSGVKREDNMHPFYLLRVRTNINYLITC